MLILFQQLLFLAIILLFFPLSKTTWGPNLARSLWRLLRHWSVSKFFYPSIILFLFLFYAAHILAFGVARPSIYDEFAYIIMGDTFAHGRLSNPTHPMWPFFETVHVIHQPTFMGKYPPAQGLVLAFGQLVFGHQFYGVILGTVSGILSILWMLRAWLPRPWMGVGAFMMLLQLESQIHNWSFSYWGGWVFATGGALLYGAVRRFWEKPSPVLGGVMALGVGIMMLSRPFEGFIITLPALGCALVAFYKHWQPGNVCNLCLAGLTSILIFAPVLGWQGYYNYRVTGSPWVMPYVIHYKTYEASPIFWMQKPSASVPIYQNKVLKELWVDNIREIDYLPKRQSLCTLSGFCKYVAKRVLRFLYSYMDIITLVPFFVACWVCRKPWHGFAFGTVAWYFLMSLNVAYALPHYSAAIMCLIFYILVEGLRFIRVIKWRGKPVGSVFFGFSLSAMFLLFLGYEMHFFLSQREGLREDFIETKPPYHSSKMKFPFLQDEEHLVFVRYGPSHNIHSGWVHNAADIDAAPVVWAHDRGVQENVKLIHYYPKRKVWLFEPDEDERLTPYTMP